MQNLRFCGSLGPNFVGIFSLELQLWWWNPSSPVQMCGKSASLNIWKIEYCSIFSELIKILKTIFESYMCLIPSPLTPIQLKNKKKGGKKKKRKRTGNHDPKIKFRSFMFWNNNKTPLASFQCINSLKLFSNSFFLQ